MLLKRSQRTNKCENQRRKLHVDYHAVLVARRHHLGASHIKPFRLQKFREIYNKYSHRNVSTVGDVHKSVKICAMKQHHRRFQRFLKTMSVCMVNKTCTEVRTDTPIAYCTCSKKSQNDGMLPAKSVRDGIRWHVAYESDHYSHLQNMTVLLGWQTIQTSVAYAMEACVAGFTTKCGCF